MTSAMPEEHRVAVVIPALNESHSIAHVVRAIRPYAYTIVVDDGSVDDTSELARREGAQVMRHPRRRGYDQALETGMRQAAHLNFAFVITMDADGQHRAELIPLFVAELVRGASVVVGVRDKHQRLAEKGFSIVSRMLWGVRDPLCGMKGYGVDVFREAGCFDSYGSIGTELTIRACRSGLPIAQVPVSTQDRVGDARFGAGLKPNLRILRALLLGLLRARPLASSCRTKHPA